MRPEPSLTRLPLPLITPASAWVSVLAARIRAPSLTTVAPVWAITPFTCTGPLPNFTSEEAEVLFVIGVLMTSALPGAWFASVSAPPAASGCRVPSVRLVPIVSDAMPTPMARSDTARVWPLVSPTAASHVVAWNRAPRLLSVSPAREIPPSVPSELMRASTAGSFGRTEGPLADRLL